MADLQFDSSGTAEFNSSLQKIYMMANLEKAAHTFMIRNNLIDMYTSLQGLEIELDYKMIPDEIKSIKELKSKIVKAIAGAVSDKNGQTKWMGLATEGMLVSTSRFSETKDLLIEYMKKLLRYKHKYGLGMKEGTDPSFALNET